MKNIPEICCQPDTNKVVLAWASRKRHIFVNGILLCASRHKTGDGYNHKGGHYMSYQLEFPTWEKRDPDQKCAHFDGIIPAKPLDEIGGIIRSSICTACQKRYDKIFK